MVLVFKRADFTHRYFDSGKFYGIVRMDVDNAASTDKEKL